MVEIGFVVCSVVVCERLFSLSVCLSFSLYLPFYRKKRRKKKNKSARSFFLLIL